MQNIIKNKLKINRQSNIELLRIIAMIFIIAHHFAVHGGFNFSTDIITVNSLWIQFIKIGGKIGVNIFVLISGSLHIISIFVNFGLIASSSEKLGTFLTGTASAIGVSAETAVIPSAGAYEEYLLTAGAKSGYALGSPCSVISRPAISSSALVLMP